MLCRLNRRGYRLRRTSFVSRSRRPMLGLLVATATIALAALLAMNRYVVMNLSPSLPFGLYRRVAYEPDLGRLVEFRLPIEPPRMACQARAQVVLKPIVAALGDYVDTSGDWLWINGHRVAPIHTTDSAGHGLSVWRASRRLEENEFFTYSSRVPNSFDSRYYGPIQRRDIRAVYVPLWTWGEVASPDQASFGSAQ